MAGVSPEQYRRAAEALGSPVALIAERAPVGRRFTTRDLIGVLRAEPEGEAQYQSALAVLQESGIQPMAAAQVLHGQVIPELLRADPGVRFAGFAHDQPDDGIAVPSYWTRQAER